MKKTVMEKYARSIGLVFGVYVVVAPGVAHGEDDGSALQAEEKGNVSVAVDPAMPDAEVTRRWLEERAQQVGDELQWPLGGDGRLQVEVSGTLYDYRIEVTVWWRGERLPAQYQATGGECLCDSDEMLDQVGGAVKAGATALAEVAEQERVEEARERARALEAEEKRRAEVKAEADAARAAALAVERPATYRPGKLGNYGIGVASVGAFMAISGSIMVGRGAREPQGTWAERKDFSGPGFAVLGIGAAALVGGVSVVVVDVVRCRRKPDRCGGPVGSQWAREGW